MRANDEGRRTDTLSAHRSVKAALASRATTLPGRSPGSGERYPAHADCSQSMPGQINQECGDCRPPRSSPMVSSPSGYHYTSILRCVETKTSSRKAHCGYRKLHLGTGTFFLAHRPCNQFQASIHDAEIRNGGRKELPYGKIPRYRNGKINDKWNMKYG